MRINRLLLLFVLIVSLLLPCTATVVAQTPVRDPQAITVLTQAIAAMGGSVPSDSTATGTVTLVAGSTTETGTARILTRGSNQTLEEISTSQQTRELVHSRGMASELQGAALTKLNMQQTGSSQCPDFPLPLISAALNNQNFTLNYVGLETLDGVSVHHVRFSDTFASRPRLQSLSKFTIKDVWIDAASSQPRKLSFTRHEAGGPGAGAGLFIEVFFSDYRQTSGVKYPFLIKKSLNGTHWITVTVQNVSLNTGSLSDADFPVPAR